jgi:hypothetical protein
MTLDGVQIYGNNANRNENGLGGGIQNSGILTLKSGSIDCNTALTYGGGIRNSIAGKVSGCMSLVHDNTLTNGIPDDISP